jgi:hypothetical protein
MQGSASDNVEEVSKGPLTRTNESGGIDRVGPFPRFRKRLIQLNVLSSRDRGFDLVVTSNNPSCLKNVGVHKVHCLDSPPYQSLLVQHSRITFSSTRLYLVFRLFRFIFMIPILSNGSTLKSSLGMKAKSGQESLTLRR